MFNYFFGKQRSVRNNSSDLAFNLFGKTNKSISTVTFTSDNMATLIRDRDSNKADGHDMLNIHMLKLCGNSIRKCIKHGELPTEWKKANVGPVHRKSDKQIVKNYRPISLLLILGKIFERLLCIV